MSAIFMTRTCLKIIIQTNKTGYMGWTYGPVFFLLPQLKGERVYKLGNLCIPPMTTFLTKCYSWWIAATCLFRAVIVIYAIHDTHRNLPSKGQVVLFDPPCPNCKISHSVVHFIKHTIQLYIQELTPCF